MGNRIAILDGTGKVANIVRKDAAVIPTTEVELDDADVVTGIGTQLPDYNANGADLRTKAKAALALNDTFLAIGSPTNAQVLAQTKLLTKQCTGIIRLALNLLDSTAGT